MPDAIIDRIKMSEREISQFFISQYTDSEFGTFLYFLPIIFPNDSKIPYLRDSISTKIRALEYLTNDIVIQYQKVLDEKNESKGKGSREKLQHEILLIKFESFLNFAYSLLDNLAETSNHLYNDLPKYFNRQISWVKKNRKDFPQYHSYCNLIASCVWYEKLHTMRTSATHLLEGLVCWSDKGPGIMYFDKNPKNNEKILIDDIQEYTIQTNKDILAFLNRFGEHFLEKYCEPDSKVKIICGVIPSSDNTDSIIVGMRYITYNEYQNKEVGTCSSIKTKCHLKDKCPAYARLQFE
jgi:hypothetical protein